MRRGLIAAVVAGVCLAGAGQAGAVFPGANGRIVYATGQGAQYSVHTILPSGHSDQVIGRAGLQFSWSPSGRRIVFRGGNDNIYTMRADGSDVRFLARNGYGPAYSPGGGRIVFGRGTNDTVLTMRSDGSNRRVIANGGSPVWAPDGEIAFARDSTGSKPGGLWAMRPNGTHRHHLVTLGENGGYGPMYFPDGSKFLFVRYDYDGLAKIRLADADGSNVRQPPCKRLFSNVYADPNRQGPLPITYSPDGRWLLVRQGFQFEVENLVRLSLGSCAGKRVVGGTTGDADWQPLP